MSDGFPPPGEPWDPSAASPPSDPWNPPPSASPPPLPGQAPSGPPPLPDDRWGYPPGGPQPPQPPPGYQPQGYGYPPPGSPPPGYPPSVNPPGGYPPQGYGYGYTSMAQEHPQGTTILILGLVSLVFCAVTGPFAWVMGNRALREIDAAPQNYSNRSSVVAGRIIGIITSCLLILGVLFFVLIIVVGVLGESSSSTNGSTLGLMTVMQVRPG